MCAKVPASAWHWPSFPAEIAETSTIKHAKSEHFTVLHPAPSIQMQRSPPDPTSLSSCSDVGLRASSRITGQSKFRPLRHQIANLTPRPPSPPRRNSSVSLTPARPPPPPHLHPKPHCLPSPSSTPTSPRCCPCSPLRRSSAITSMARSAPAPQVTLMAPHHHLHNYKHQPRLMLTIRLLRYSSRCFAAAEG